MGEDGEIMRKTLLLVLVLAGCAAPLSKMTPEKIASLSDHQVSLYCTLEPGAQTEALARARGFSCDKATTLCWKAGLTEKSPKWSDCYVQAAGIVSQAEAADAARRAAYATSMQNVAAQNAMVNAMNRPRTCSGFGNSVTCY